MNRFHFSVGFPSALPENSLSVWTVLWEEGQQGEDPSRGNGLKFLFPRQGPILSSESHILDSLLRKLRFDAGG